MGMAGGKFPHFKIREKGWEWLRHSHEKAFEISSPYGMVMFVIICCWYVIA